MSMKNDKSYLDRLHISSDGIMTIDIDADKFLEELSHMKKEDIKQVKKIEQLRKEAYEVELDDNDRCQHCGEVNAYHFDCPTCGAMSSLLLWEHPDYCAGELMTCGECYQQYQLVASTPRHNFYTITRQI